MKEKDVDWLDEPETVPRPDEPCHCGKPVYFEKAIPGPDPRGFTRGLCADCDAERCDAPEEGRVYSCDPKETSIPATGRSPDHRHVSCNRSEEHTSELQSRENLVCRLLLEKKKHGGRLGAEQVQVATGHAADIRSMT